MRECAVVLREKNDSKYLVAYYVLKNPADTINVRQFLSAALPDYMVPPFYIQLLHMPLTPNGKLDRHALPDPESVTDEEYVGPTGDKEEMMVNIWSQVLEISREKISVHKSFFDLGGNSLKILRLHSMIRDHFEKELSIPDMFQYTTISQMIRSISGPQADTEYLKAEAAEEVSGMNLLFNTLGGN